MASRATQVRGPQWFWPRSLPARWSHGEHGTSASALFLNGARTPAVMDLGEVEWVVHVLCLA